MLTLTGSEKQVAWAEDIRNSYVKKVEWLESRIKKIENAEATQNYRYKFSPEEYVANDVFRSFWPHDGFQKLEDQKATLENFKNALDTQDTAKFWIDAR